MIKTTNGHAATLDQKIAACFASDDCDKAALVKLFQEAEAAITEAKATIETESANALDIANPDPDESDLAVRRAQRTIARLDQALPKLRERIKSIEAFEYTERWHADADKLEILRDSLADELAKFYPWVVEHLADIFAKIDQNTAAIDRLHMNAPRGENRRLLDAELVARKLPGYDAAHPPLRNNLQLPDWGISREVAYPASPTIWNERARLMAEALAKQMADKFALTHGPQWAEARELAIKEEQEAFAQRDKELKRDEAESKAAYERHQQEAELRRRPAQASLAVSASVVA